MICQLGAYTPVTIVHCVEDGTHTYVVFSYFDKQWREGCLIFTKDSVNEFDWIIYCFFFSSKWVDEVEQKDSFSAEIFNQFCSNLFGAQFNAIRLRLKVTTAVKAKLQRQCDQLFGIKSSQTSPIVYMSFYLKGDTLWNSPKYLGNFCKKIYSRDLKKLIPQSAVNLQSNFSRKNPICNLQFKKSFWNGPLSSISPSLHELFFCDLFLWLYVGLNMFTMLAKKMNWTRINK